MKITRIFIIVILALGLAGCATVPGTDTGPTCATANLTLQESRAILADLKAQGIVTGDAVTYWTLAQHGATLFLIYNGCTVTP